MGKKSHTAAPSMKLSTPSKPTHPNPGALPKLPGMHSAVGNLGIGKAHKMGGKC